MCLRSHCLNVVLEALLQQSDAIALRFEVGSRPTVREIAIGFAAIACPQLDTFISIQDTAFKQLRSSAFASSSVSARSIFERLLEIHPICIDWHLFLDKKR
ncbi:hypothetical protein CKA32_004696 [Geitlerinema sp. FC II]|nr:hypothetical protein CKA32_004696 [Geitlerinema sp. FC II]